MLVKITDFPDDQIEDLKHATGQNTASKAVFFAATQFVKLAEENTELSFHCAQLDEEIARLRHVLLSARHACSQVLETVNQRDMFASEEV